MKKKIAKLAADVALKTAILASGAASWWNTYQPKEPVALKKLSK